MDREKPETTLANGQPVTPDYRELKPNGQQKDYLVLSDAERAKGFVRPVRRTYLHIGKKPKGTLRDLDPNNADDKLALDAGFIKASNEDGILYWTAADLKPGCGTQTSMSQSIAETYARDPKFYGATFCCQCGKHLPVAEFVWLDNPDQQVGS